MSVPASAAQALPVDREHGLELLREMLRIRRFEERAAEQYSLAKIRGFLHLYIGEEAVAVGVMQALTPDDAVVATYREHGQALARGLPASSLMAEMFGKASGCSRGRGGSMHFFDLSRRFYGGYGIVGGGIPIAVGLALADKMQGKQRVTACFFGDGAVAEGEFHESLNLAALWKLPVLFLCENNLYAMGTPITQELAVTDIRARAESYGIPARAVDGMHVLEVEAAARQAADQVRTTGEPRFLELHTYRFRAHSMADPDLYRTKGEIEDWKLSDPIPHFDELLRKEGLLTDDDLTALEAEIAAELDEAIAFADAAPIEPVEDLLEDVTTPASA
ncbi:MAG: pyruvate dehydrogenase (acetyl-transferring) E1 component subunit alpha [Gaiellaceae bacterium]